MPDTVAPKSRSWLAVQLSYALNPPQFRRALADIAEGWRHRALWTTIGLHDIRQRYRRSIIGPFWITISMGVMVAAIGTLYSQILKIDTTEYLPYLSAGFVAWGLISTLVVDGCQTFISAENLIKQLSAPLAVHAYRVLWGNFLTLVHNIWIFVAVALWFNVNPGWAVLAVLPALVLVYLNGLWIALLLGLMSARFRDIPMIVGSIVQVMLFMTPIFWRPDMLPGRTVLLDGNPFYHFVTIIRSPLLGQMPALENWIAVILITVVGWALALFFYTAYRWRIAYWV
jgi:ABC-2 type transport system permease protein/lipopolysaccharide transport system permease protein